MNWKIRTTSEKDLYSFFLSLSNEVLYNFTPFGQVNKSDIAKKVARRESKKPLREQKNFGIYIDSVMVGFGFLRFFEKYQRRYTCTLGMVIHQDYQCKHYGKKLLRAMIGWAKTHEYKKIWLSVYSDNFRAIKFYKNFGFHVEGIFMYDEYFKDVPRHIISMALIFDKDIRKGSFLEIVKATGEKV